MKCTIQTFSLIFSILLLLLLSSCVGKKANTAEEAPATTEDLVAKAVGETDQQGKTGMQLPVRYQNPSFVVADEAIDKGLESDKEYVVKVGANIRSTRGPQPLWDIMKRLANLKGMSVSWSSDVDQNVLVDVDISASDNFFEAIDHMLRQVDYFHEINGNTIIVKYKETKTYHVAMPFTKQMYETATGGNVLGASETGSSVEGTIRLDSRSNEFDIWKNIHENLDSIIATWSTTASAPPEAAPAEAAEAAEGNEGDAAVIHATRQTSSSGNSYTVDKPVGLITVNAPRPLQEKIEAYLDNLEHELYKQVSIEAKIVEVQLNDSTSLGLDWNLLLRNLSGQGYFLFDNNYANSQTNTNSRDNTITDTLTDAFGNSVGNNTTDTRTTTIDHLTGTTTADGTTSTGIGTNVSSTSRDRSIVNTATAATTAATIITNGVSDGAAGLINLATFNFAEFINALSQQGTTSVLSNPKLSVLNGQPALLTVGRNVTYIDSIESQVTTGSANPVTNYTVNTERILSGIGLSLTATINNDDEIILNLVPVTSELQEPIEYRNVGLGQVGLPIVNIREMSTTVKVQDQEMLVIGGLISDVDQSSGNFIPGVGDIPVMKYLFGYEEKIKRKRELIILLRPRII